MNSWASMYVRCIPYLRYIFPLLPTFATVNCRPSRVVALASAAGSFPSLFNDRCRSMSVLFLVRFSEFWRPLLRVLSDDFLCESMLCSRLWRIVDAFSWPRPTRIEGISERASVHPLLTGLGGWPLCKKLLCTRVVAGAMAITANAWHFPPRWLQPYLSRNPSSRVLVSPDVY